ncbi:MAG: hypothetical protein ACJA2P_000214 [Rhodoferax sp.]|jgi:hypothetical protein
MQIFTVPAYTVKRLAAWHNWLHMEMTRLTEPQATQANQARGKVTPT